MWELLDQLPDTGVEKDFYKVTDSNGKEYLSIRLKLRDILYFEYIKRSRKVLIALADITYMSMTAFLKNWLKNCSHMILL